MDQISPLTAKQGYGLRKGNKDDLDDIIQVHFDGFIDEPMDNYCYPSRFKHQDDHFKWLRKEYEYYLDNPQKYMVHVVDVLEQPEKGGNRKTMALAVWNIAVLAIAPAALGRLKAHAFHIIQPRPAIRANLWTVRSRFGRTE